MGERFSEEAYERAVHREQEPLLEAKTILQELDKLLAKLVEQGGDLSATTKQALKDQIQAHLASLGLTNLDQVYEFSRQVYQRTQERVNNPQIPINYPDLYEFKLSYAALLRETPLYLPHVGRRVEASWVSRYGQSDWKQIKGRGINIIDYSYDLGKLLSDRVAYATVFDPIDQIRITRNWLVDNGRHRTLTLRILGERYVIASGMDSWVLVQPVT